MMAKAYLQKDLKSIGTYGCFLIALEKLACYFVRHEPNPKIEATNLVSHYHILISEGLLKDDCEVQNDCRVLERLILLNGGPPTHVTKDFTKGAVGIVKVRTLNGEHFVYFNQGVYYDEYPNVTIVKVLQYRNYSMEG
jgi:hypothetical protein